MRFEEIGEKMFAARRDGGFENGERVKNGGGTMCFVAAGKMRLVRAAAARRSYS